MSFSLDQHTMGMPSAAKRTKQRIARGGIFLASPLSLSALSFSLASLSSFSLASSSLPLLAIRKSHV